MKNTKVRVAIIATLSVIAVVLGVIAFMPAKEQAKPVTIPTYTPEIIEFKLVTTPSPTPPPMPTETPISEAIEEVQPTPESTKAPAVQPEKSIKVTGAFALGIDGSTVQVAYGVEEKTLEKSPGWLDTSASPGEEGVCVVYGHRNRNHLKVLKNVEVGETITVTMPEGRAFSYIIESIEILDSMEDLTIPTVSRSYLLLATCYPFHYSGHAPQKYVNRGELAMKTILVLGGAGYIGSHTVYELIDSGYDVAIVDDLETGFIEAVHPKARFYEGDLRDKAFIDSVFDKERADAVIHFTANSQVDESMVKPLKYYDNNIGGTRTMLQSMIEHGVKHIVFSSTAATYGEPERIPIMESDHTQPTNCCGETKLAMEHMFRWASLAHDLHFAALRCFNACGAHPDGNIGEAHDPETHLIPLVLQVPNGQRSHVDIFGDDYDTRDGTCVRDYIHVCDLASAHVLAAEYLMSGGENDIFNLGNGVGFTVKEIVEAAEKVVGRPIPTQIMPRRAGDPAQLVASSEKAKRVLGWRPRLDDIDAIISTAWRWHSAHPHGYKKA